MTQFDVFDNPNRSARSAFPYIVVLQSDVSFNRRTTIVAPIAPKAKVQAEDRAVLAVEIDGKPFVVLASVPLPPKVKPVTQLLELRDRLPRAIDYLFLGF